MKQVQEDKKPADSGDHGELCHQVELRIHELLDKRQPLLSDVVVRSHVVDCDECAQLVIDFGALEDSLSQIPLATLYRLSGMIDADGPPHGSSRNHAFGIHPVAFVATIASLMLVMLTSSLWRSSDPDSGQSVAIAVSSDPQTRDSDSLDLSFRTEQDLLARQFISAQALDRLAAQVEPLNDPTVQNCLLLTADLPGIRQVKNSVNATLNLIRGSSRFDTVKPDDQKRSDSNEGADVRRFRLNEIARA